MPPLIMPQEALEVRLWDPSKQLRFATRTAVPPRPDGAPNRGLEPPAA